MKNFNFILSGSSLALSILALALATLNAIPGPAGSTGATGPQGGSGQNGSDGQDGETPYIGDNGHWFIGETDTGVSASGFSGNSYSAYGNFENERNLENWIIEEHKDELLNTVLDFENIGDYVQQRVLEGYVEITDALSLMSIPSATGRYVLGADLDLSTLVNWSPIVFLEGFQGTLDGAGYTLSGLTTGQIDALYGRSNLGIFAFAKRATFKNIQIENFDFTANIDVDSASIGTLVAQAENTYFHNIQLIDCSVEGYSYIGGLVGRVDRSVLDNITAQTEVQGTSFVGGVAGDSIDSSWTQIVTSESNQVTGFEYAIGGVVGGSENSTFITIDSYGEVSFDGASSNLTGGLGGTFGLLLRCYVLAVQNHTSVLVPAVNQTSGVYYVGGIAGFAATSHLWAVHNWGLVKVLYQENETYPIESVGGLVGEFQDSVLVSSYNTATVAAVLEVNEDIPAPLSSYIGGLIGYQRNQGLILGCTNYGTVLGYTEIGGIVGGTGFFISVWSALEIYQTSNLAPVIGNNTLGGILGSIDGYFYFNIQDSFNQGALYGQSTLGGLVGSVGTLNGSISYIRNSYNVGNLHGAFALGGLVGASAPSILENHTGILNIEHSFNLGSFLSNGLGQGYNDFSDLAIGSIYGVRALGGTMTNVLHPINSVQVLFSLYDADLEDYVLTGEEVTMLLPSVGSGYQSGAVMVNGVEAFEQDSFHFAEVWDMENIWGFDDAYLQPMLRHNPLLTFAG